MAQHILLGSVSTSSSFTGSKSDLSAVVDSRVKWESLKTFIYLAETFSSSNINFDLLSGNIGSVPLWFFCCFAAVIGMPYMCMDVFIKQYTGKLDLNETLIPLVKAVNCAIMLHTAMWSLLTAVDLSEAVLFFMSCLVGLPPWLNCESEIITDSKCVPMLNLTIFCLKKKTPGEHASHYSYYRNLFIFGDKSVITRRIFLIALVWIINFFVTTLSEQVLLKLFKICFIFRKCLEFFFIGYVGISKADLILISLKRMVSLEHVRPIWSIGPLCYTFGVGLVGIYDFGAMSPFTAVDNAVVGFTLIFTTITFVRSIILRVLLDLVKGCIELDYIHYHFYIMATLPLGSMFLRLQRLNMILIFLIMITTLFPHLAAVTCTIGKLLHSEFRSVKYMYFSGFLSFFGFILSSILALYVRIPWVTASLRRAIFSSMYCFAFLRAVIVLYIYGVHKFTEDIHFWLGFKPSIYWIVAWSIMPAILFYKVVDVSVMMVQPLIVSGDLIWRVCVGITFLIVLLVTLKTIGKYATSNKLLAILRPSPKYGPPDADERKRRKRYDETVSLRQCVHNCIPLDDRFDCCHIPRAEASVLLDAQRIDSEMSMMSMSEMFDVQQLRD